MNILRNALESPPGPSAGCSFNLIDQNGRDVTDKSYHGRFALVFFGFTRCRVVCPRALAKLSAVLESLGPPGSDIVPLYITVDPERDTPKVMQAFLQSYPRFGGLTGSHRQIDEAKQAFRVFSRRLESSSAPGDYDVRHTAITYMMDREGRYLDHFADSTTAEAITDRVRALMGAA